MWNQRRELVVVWAALAWWGAGGLAAAQLVFDPSGVPAGPGIASSTENVDFGDVDLDGDWDAVFADGGDDGNDQNRIWINRGESNGLALGTFEDSTALRLPAVSDDSRDIEFADIDGDGDLDLHVSNTSSVVNQGNRWWINAGGQQGQTLGFFVDETAARWVGLGGSGSSIDSAIVGNGTFFDWTSDSDFGDLDNDGDLDLVHSSYGQAFGGQVPTRLFLNDGSGFFEEFNPSGFQLQGDNIVPGNPALWAEGVQESNTADSTGQKADISTTATDVELGDVDGDFDLDLLHGARDERPRIFRNRLAGTPSTLAFRDVTSSSFSQPSWAFGGLNNDQELGDLDGDGDLDLYGANWAGFSDRTFRNDGNGLFSVDESVVANSGGDHEEADFIDYDNDGDLDVFVASFSGLDVLYRNDGALGGLAVQQQVGVGGNARSLDAEVADLDKDGDYDVIVAEDNFVSNSILLNTTAVADTHAPYIPRVENAGDRPAVPGVGAVRAQVYDNAPLYITWYNPTVIDVAVDGVAIGSFAMRSSQGNVFRGELPSNLVGSVSYVVRSEDEYGNSGSSAPETFSGSFAGALGGPFGLGTAGAAGTPDLAAASVPFSNSTLYLTVDQVAAGATVFLVLADASLAAPLTLPGIGSVNIAGNQLAQLIGTAGFDDDIAFALPIGSVPAGLTVFGQAFATDGVGGNLLSTSNGLEIVTQ